MNNCLDDFQRYCEAKGMQLNEPHKGLATQFFATPAAGGKTALLALLYYYDPSAEKVANNLRLPQSYR